MAETQAFLKQRPQADLATQSGPMLVIDGRMHPRFDRGGTSLKAHWRGPTGGWQNHIRHHSRRGVVRRFCTPIPRRPDCARDLDRECIGERHPLRRSKRPRLRHDRRQGWCEKQSGVASGPPPLVRDGRLTSHRFESCHGNDLIALGLATTRRRLNWVQARVSAIISLPSTYSASKGCDDQLSDPIRGRR